MSRRTLLPQHCIGSTDASALSFLRDLVAAVDLPLHSALFSQQLLDLTHEWRTERDYNEIALRLQCFKHDWRWR